MTNKAKQARYQFVAQTAKGEKYRLVNINLENNTVTYRKPNNEYGYLELDKVTLTMIDNRE